MDITTADTSSTLHTQAPSVDVQHIPSAFPAVQPLRAALHFNSPKGFGEWRILIPSNAQKDLRDAHKKNRVLFKIVEKKLKYIFAALSYLWTSIDTIYVRELSNGHFSDDNQKKLNGSSPHGVPIFEAKMHGDGRLVVGFPVFW